MECAMCKDVGVYNRTIKHYPTRESEPIFVKSTVYCECEAGRSLQDKEVAERRKYLTDEVEKLLIKDWKATWRDVNTLSIVVNASAPPPPDGRKLQPKHFNWMDGWVGRADNKKLTERIIELQKEIRVLNEILKLKYEL
jgi:hypothetical protein